jgi:hypothetical protein
MSIIAELANRLGVLPPSAASLSATASPSAYLAYLASLIIEFGAGGALFVVLGLRVGRGLVRWIRGWSIPPEHLVKLAIPVACLLTSAGLLALDIR